MYCRFKGVHSLQEEWRRGEAGEVGEREKRSKEIQQLSNSYSFFPASSAILFSGAGFPLTEFVVLQLCGLLLPSSLSAKLGELICKCAFKVKLAAKKKRGEAGWSAFSAASFYLTLRRQQNEALA